MATRYIGSASLNMSRNSSFKNLSGETKSTFISPPRNICNVS
uniref:Uncharacterized protein n=1 Tax=Arundo donax TaxID=35708 RepID=A0A0A9E269_ARUDO